MNLMEKTDCKGCFYSFQNRYVLKAYYIIPMIYHQALSWQGQIQIFDNLNIVKNKGS